MAGDYSGLLGELPFSAYSEKSSLDQAHEIPARKAKKPTPVHRWIIAFLIIAGYVVLSRNDLFTQLPSEPCMHREPKDDRFGFGTTNFDSFALIPASADLKWVHCYDEFLCARLQVPMDYNRNATASTHPTVEVALLMVPGAGHLESGKFSVSPLLLNPGGPGGSGVGLALSAGSLIQNVVGTDRDIIGFDPRGIGATTPIADCFSFPGNGKEITDDDRRTGWFNSLTWIIAGQAEEIAGNSPGSLKRLDERAKTGGIMCANVAALKGDDHILRHLSTPAVATDMVSIVDAWDAWRARSGQDVDDEVLEVNLDTKGKLVYWGFSYGTLLGATFASMFPDRVGRVILDGVVDADLYVSPAWDGSLEDTDAVEASFWHFCAKAKTECALYRDEDSEDDIKDRYFGILESLAEEPIIGMNSATRTPSIVTVSNVRGLIFSALYNPSRSYPFMAQLLNTYHKGDKQAILDMVVHPSNIASYVPFTSATLPIMYQPADAQDAIMCSDKRYPLNSTLPELDDRLSTIQNISRFGDIWMTLMIGCNNWPIKAIDPPMRWDNHPDNPRKYEKPIKTANPVLFISNTADPVTPLSAGVKMAGKFKGAGLVQVDIEGHCSIAQVSVCALLRIRKYLEKGEVPGLEVGEDGNVEWVVCERDEDPWKPFNGTLSSGVEAMILENEGLGALNGEISATVAIEKAVEVGWTATGLSEAVGRHVGMFRKKI